MTKSVGNALTGLAVGVLVASCASNPVDVIKDITAENPAAPYLGMSVPEVISCAGEPHARYHRGDNAETLTYRYSGAGPRAGAKDDAWTCAASLLFNDGRLAGASFAPKKGKEPCAFSLPNCHR
jgi:hypothetical protein